MLYYGESAYWVNVDVDVPLFLPLSGQRRLYDLRRTARLESAQHVKIQGQGNFESGWEYGYYLSNVITARAVWNPRLEIADDWLAYETMLSDLFVPTFGSVGASLVKSVVEVAQVQADLWIYSKINQYQADRKRSRISSATSGSRSTDKSKASTNGTNTKANTNRPHINTNIRTKTPSDLTKLSGHAYMSGSDTWVDIPRLLGLSFTQPDKIHVTENTDANWDTMMSLLTALDTTLQAQAQNFIAIEQQMLQDSGLSSKKVVVAYVTELSNVVQLLALRAKHVSFIRLFSWFVVVACCDYVATAFYDSTCTKKTLLILSCSNSLFMLTHDQQINNST